MKIILPVMFSSEDFSSCQILKPILFEKAGFEEEITSNNQILKKKVHLKDNVLSQFTP